MQGDVAMMWLFEYMLYRTNRVKIKTDIINKDNRFLWCSMCSLVEIFCVFEEKIGLVCWQLLHDLHAMDILWFNLPVNFVYFLESHFM